MTLYITLFIAGLFTILLPCILPLLPIVLGVSVAGKSKLRPLLTVLGMVISFVGFTFVLLVFLNQFVELADYIRIATFYALILFGVAFAFHQRAIQIMGAVLGALLFVHKGWPSVIVAAIVGVIALELGTRVASKLQNLGASVQTKARGEFGADSPLTALIIGLTLGLVWVPCAGPALGFALTLVREQPGPMAALALLSYALGTAVPLIAIGYGGQAAVHSVRAISPYSGRIKQVAGILLILTAIGLQFDVFTQLQVWVADNTSFGNISTSIENSLFPTPDSTMPMTGSGSSSSTSAKHSSSSPATMNLPSLPKLVRAPEFVQLGPWHNSQPFTLASLKGKVVLVDFWTYSCINCIRTLPYIEGYWNKYKDTGKFVLLGVHTPEFTFEQSESNVAMALKEHGLTYPVAQDNDYETWDSFANHYWPAKYLIDADGYVRYTHFGEGDYDETDAAIASLLQEDGVDVTKLNPGKVASSENGSGFGPISPETYVGTRNWPAFGNSQGDPTTDVIAYKAPTTMELNKFYLNGSWQLADNEKQVLRTDSGDIRMKFQGGEINLVLGLEEGAKPVQASVTIDGKPGTTFTVDRHDLFNLFKGQNGTHDIILSFQGKGVQAFAFTFGQ